MKLTEISEHKFLPQISVFKQMKELKIIDNGQTCMYYLKRSLVAIQMLLLVELYKLRNIVVL